MSAWSPDAGYLSGQVPEPACDVYYLRIEPHVGGFRWVIAKSGAVSPVLVGPVFPTDYNAKVSGRAKLDEYMAQQNNWSARRPENSAVGQISSDR